MSYPTNQKLKELCKLADLKCSGTKQDLVDRIDNYLSKYKYAPRYLRGLNKIEKFNKKFDIRYYKLLETKKGIKSYSPDKFKTTKQSKYTQTWNSRYENAKSLEQKARVSGVPKDILKKVYNKGLAAWRGGSHRPGASQQSWGISRVNSFLLCGKTWEYPDHKLVEQAMKKSPRARQFWKKCNKKRLGRRTPSK